MTLCQYTLFLLYYYIKMKRFFILFVCVCLFVYGFVRYRECVQTDQCSGHGWCSVVGCICDADYVTFRSSDNKECNYKRKCLTGEQCNFNGECDETGSFCHCAKSYITFKPEDSTECNYRQKNSVVALIIHLIFGGTGMTDMYLGNYMLACIQLVATVVLGYWTLKWYRYDSTRVEIEMFVCLYAIWIYNFVLILMNKKLDGNGAPLSAIH